MPEPMYTPREGVGARYKDPDTGAEYVFTNGGWKKMSTNIGQDVQDTGTFVVKPDETNLETKMLQGGANRQDIEKTLAERRRIKLNATTAQNSKTDKVSPIQERDETNPFSGMDKKELLRAAFNAGVHNTDELNKLGDMYDTLAGSQEDDMTVVGELVKQRKELADAGFSTDIIDSKLEDMGFSKVDDMSLMESDSEFAPVVDRTIDKLEEISGLGTENTIFTGGETTIGKGLKSVGIFTRKAIDPEFSVKVNEYKNILDLLVGPITQIQGSGTPQEAEAARLLTSIPDEYTSEKEAKAWFNNARTVLGVGLDKVDNEQVSTTENQGLMSKFVSGVGESLGQRAENIKSEIQGFQEKEVSSFDPIANPRVGLHVAGEVAGGINDITGEIIKLVTPQFVEDFVSNAVGKVTDTDVAQAAIGEYKKWEEKHPEGAKDLSSIMNIGLLATDVAALKGGKEAVKSAKSLFKKPVKNVDDVIKQADEAVTLTSKIDDTVTKAGTTAEKRSVAEATTLKPSIKEKWAGISPDIKNRIAGKQYDLKEYFDVAHTRNYLDTAPTPLEYATTKVDDAVKKMEAVINDTGSDIGSFRKKVGSYTASTEQLETIENTFTEQLKRLNLEVKKGKIRQVPGKVSKLGSKNDIKVLQELFDDLGTVKQAGDLERLIDLRSAFDKKINFGKSAREVSSTIDPVSRNVRKKIADVAAEMVGKTEAKKLKQYSEFMDAYDMLTGYTNRKAGSEFLLKQVLSERGRTPREIMDAIKEYTGIDLMDDAVMSSIATDLIGNSRQKGLFRQEIMKAGLDATAVLRGDPRGAVDLMFNFLEKGLINKEKQFLKAAR